MRFNKLDLNLLVALEALLTERSTTRAAERLHLSQSAMSGALARLREYFDDDLLVQVGRQMEPTPRAEVLHEAVRDVLLRIDTSITVQPAFDCTTSEREFRLFVSDYTQDVLMPQVLALAAQQGATVRFRLLPQVALPARSLERGEADLLVIPLEYCSTEHPAERLFEDNFVCVVWDQSRHAREGLSVEQYAAAAHVAMQPAETQQTAHEQRSTQDQGLSRRIEVRTYSFATIPLLVIGTERVATVHRLLAQRLQAALPIRLLPVPVPIPPLQQGLQWHKYRTQDPGLKWLRQVMHEAANTLPPPEGPHA
jgi:DNA-binding transcriptional LysR family regulator